MLKFLWCHCVVWEKAFKSVQELLCFPVKLIVFSERDVVERVVLFESVHYYFKPLNSKIIIIQAQRLYKEWFDFKYVLKGLEDASERPLETNFKVTKDWFLPRFDKRRSHPLLFILIIDKSKDFIDKHFVEGAVIGF